MKGEILLMSKSILFLEKLLKIAEQDDIEFLVELLFDLKREEAASNDL
jgi:hypothetical protein